MERGAAWQSGGREELAEWREGGAGRMEGGRSWQNGWREELAELREGGASRMEGRSGRMEGGAA
jgi:hypothetical protein